MVACRQGFYWWELDPMYLVLRVLAAVGLVWDRHGVPDHIREPATAAADDASARQSVPALDVP